MAKSRIDGTKFGRTLDESEVQSICESAHYQPGRPYQWVLTQGWVCVGYFVRMESPIEIRVAHASYYRSAGNQTHASLAQNGGNSQTVWEYFGEVVINKMQVILSPAYHGEVPHGRIAR